MIQAPLAFPLGFLSFQVELGGHQLHELLLVKEAMNTLGLVHITPCLFQGGENIITFLFFSLSFPQKRQRWNLYTNITSFVV